MKIMLIGSKIELTTGIHLLRFSKSFLDLPGAAWFMYLLIHLLHSSKKGSEVRAAPRRKISDLGFLSDLARDRGSRRGRAAPPVSSCAGWGAAQVYPVLERLQGRLGVLQCVDLVSLRRFHHAGAKQTKLSDSDHGQGDPEHGASPVQTRWVSIGFSSRMVTKRVRLVESAFRLGRKSAQAVGEVTLAALLRFASLVAENQQSSMRETSKLAAGWC